MIDKTKVIVLFKIILILLIVLGIFYGISACAFKRSSDDFVNVDRLIKNVMDKKYTDNKIEVTNYKEDFSLFCVGNTRMCREVFFY